MNARLKNEFEVNERGMTRKLVWKSNAVADFSACCV